MTHHSTFRNGRMLKMFLIVFLSAWIQSAWADGERAFQYRPDGARDWSANYYERKDDTWIPYRPDGQRDWKANSVRVEGDKAIQYRPDGSRDYKLPIISK